MAEQQKGQQLCHALLNTHRLRLAKLARETVAEGYALEEFVVVCIDTSDSEWSKVVDHLMANLDCDLEDGDGTPVVIGAIPVREAVLVFGSILPGISRMLNNRIKDGRIRTLVIHDRHASELYFEEFTGEDLPN